MSEVKIMLGASFTELENGQTYYARVYTVNPEGYMQSEIGTQIGSATPQDFPAEPSEYLPIGTYTSEQTWTAPEDGWFKIEVHGASGKGGIGVFGWDHTDDDDNDYYYGKTGGAGGGGAYACSIVKLNAGDTIVTSSFAVGKVATVYINSSLEIYSNILVTSGSDGAGYGGTGGAGGVASGGDTNINGSKGTNGSSAIYDYGNPAPKAPAGGAPGHVDGNTGGAGGTFRGYDGSIAPGSGKAAFIKISRGNTNVVA